MAKAAAKIWMNAHIRTMDAALSEAQALAADSEGKLIAVGSDADVLALKRPETEVFDMGGAHIVPGLLDTHVHFRMYGESLLKLKIRDLSKEDILASVREAAAKSPAGKWIVGGMGWNNEVWEDPSYPTLAELDEAAPDNPVLLPRMDGHLIWANSLAYRAAGVSDDTRIPRAESS
ncbi:MAG: amidohydrolase family protein [Firmicutes bacterium]|nr:amidohydrolase family protein [Bacillota bacterium]